MAVLVICILSAVYGKIQGVVYDEETDQPIPFANVIISNTDIGTSTDSEGKFFILHVPSGTYTIEFSCIGYQTKYIENVVVKSDLTERLTVSLFPTLIEMSPITVQSKTPTVHKDMTGITYIIRKDEITTLPVDDVMKVIEFQPSVARLDTGLHVRGGRANEINYLIDNVSIIDPQTGEPAIIVTKGIINEVIFIPGTFDVEYGRAMSGIVNLITSRPAKKLSAEVYTKTERIMPYYYDFGYENIQSSMHIPFMKKLRSFVSFDYVHTDDWNPRLFILPHKQKYDYSLYGKCVYAPTGKLKLSFSGAKSRTQFERYDSEWKCHINNYRSDMRHGDLEVINIEFLPDTRRLFHLTLSRLYTNRIFGVTEWGDYGVFKDFMFRDYNTLQWPHESNRNAFGVDNVFISEGDYYEYQDKTSVVYRMLFKTIMQIHTHHELNAGYDLAYQDLRNFTYYISDTASQITDSYSYFPKEYSGYILDKIDFKGVFIKLGCRFEYFDPETENNKPHIQLSPRLGFSTMLTEDFIFRANIGEYTQPPLYDHVYSYYELLPFPSYIVGMKSLPPVGNPSLGLERTVAYELGIQGRISKTVGVTFNAFYKDITGLIGTRPGLDDSIPHWYVTYFNVETANVKGTETILEFSYPVFAGKISYTLSWARGSSSYANEVYELYYHENPDTAFIPPAMEYDLSFDQRHRIFVQGVLNLPFQTRIFILNYFGNGFPYSPPGPEGKTEERNTLRLPFQRRMDFVVTKDIHIGPLSVAAYVELINLLDERYEIASHGTIVPLESIRVEDFDYYLPFTNKWYIPAMDLNHDGLCSPNEMYHSYRNAVMATDDYANAYTSPRRARIGVIIKF